MRYYYLYLLHLSTLYYQATIVTLGAPACKIIEEIYYLNNNGTVNDFIASIVANDQPVLIKNLPFRSEWGAFSKWGNQTYLADALGRNNGNHIRIKKQLKKSIFTLMNPNLKLKFYPEPQQKYQLLNVSVKSFLNKIFDSTENGEEGISYQYFAGELPPTLLKDVNNDFLKVKQVEKANSYTMLWIGSKGVQAQIHYDIS